MDTFLFFMINHGAANPVFDVLMPFLTYRGYWLVIPFLFYMMLRTARMRVAEGKTYLADALWTIVICVCSVLLAEFAEYLLKVSIQRVRPCHVLEGVRLLTFCPQGYSMPSGHAISSFAFATPLFSLTRGYVRIGWRAYPLLLAAMIALSRVYVGVHYPSDIAVGAALGTAIAASLCVLRIRLAARKARRP